MEIKNVQIGQTQAIILRPEKDNIHFSFLETRRYEKSLVNLVPRQ